MPPTPTLTSPLTPKEASTATIPMDGDEGDDQWCCGEVVDLQKLQQQSQQANNHHHHPHHSSRLLSISYTHPRSSSIVEYADLATSNAAISMRRDLDKLVAALNEGAAKEKFKVEMDHFYQLFLKFLSSQTSDRLDWSRIRSPGPNLILPYAILPRADRTAEREMLSKLAVVKLNGGLGTTMGCIGPKSAIEVREGMNFLDLTVRQLEWLNREYGCKVPLLLMNSFNTDTETARLIQKYPPERVTIRTFNQSRFPRIAKDTLLPIPTGPADAKETWYPPGHGDVFNALDASGLLDELEAAGIEYLFISNIDNLGATVDTTLLGHLINGKVGSSSEHSDKIEFLMEVTDKTKADIKGGTLIDYEGAGVRLLELAQVPAEHRTDFTSIKKFKIFNTNNIWVSLAAIRRVLREDRSLDLDVIVNNKIVEATGEKVIQLETAVGAAIRHFRHSHGVNVPRTRFLPVKSCSDLFLLQSDLYQLSHGSLLPNPARPFSTVPNVKLGDHFKKVPQYLSRFAGPVHLLELDHLTVTGDVTFGANVSLKGTVIIVANHGSRIDIPAGAVLEDKVVSGNLRILDH